LKNNTTVTEVEDFTLPLEYSLAQNYPNPFNPSTTIEYSIPQGGFITLRVFNILGMEVANLVNGQVDAGKHKIEFDASGFNSGVYFYTLESGNFTKTKKMILIK